MNSSSGIETLEAATPAPVAVNQSGVWESALLARWGRLNLLLTVVEPLLPPDHPRLRLIQWALFSTYLDLAALGVRPQAFPAR